MQKFQKLQEQSRGIFTFLPVLSRPDADWLGASGYVNQQIAGREILLRKSDVYVCGVPPMIESMRGILKKAKIPKRQIFIQKFG